MPANALLGLNLLVILIRDQVHQVRREDRTGDEESARGHRAAGRHQAHVLGPDLVDVIEVLQVGLVELGLDRLVDARAGRLHHLAERVEDVVRLHLGVGAVVGEVRLAPHRNTGLEVGGRERGGKHERHRLHCVRRMLGVHRVRDGVGVDDLALDRSVIGKPNRVQVQAAARDDVVVATDDRRTGRRRIGKELLPDQLELVEVGGVDERDLGLERVLE